MEWEVQIWWFWRLCQWIRDPIFKSITLRVLEGRTCWPGVHQVARALDCSSEAGPEPCAVEVPDERLVGRDIGLSFLCRKEVEVDTLGRSGRMTGQQWRWDEHCVHNQPLGPEWEHSAIPISQFFCTSRTDWQKQCVGWAGRKHGVTTGHMSLWQWGARVEEGRLLGWTNSKRMTLFPSEWGRSVKKVHGYTGPGQVLTEVEGGRQGEMTWVGNRCSKQPQTLMWTPRSTSRGAGSTEPHGEIFTSHIASEDFFKALCCHDFNLFEMEIDPSLTWCMANSCCVSFLCLNLPHRGFWTNQSKKQEKQNNPKKKQKNPQKNKFTHNLKFSHYLR